jgi:hypothetical protein
LEARKVAGTEAFRASSSAVASAAVPSIVSIAVAGGDAAAVSRPWATIAPDLVSAESGGASVITLRHDLISPRGNRTPRSNYNRRDIGGYRA